MPSVWTPLSLPGIPLSVLSWLTTILTGPLPKANIYALSI